MEFIERTTTFAGPADPELGFPRTKPVTMHVTLPPERPRGLVFVIHGFGADTAEDYSAKLRRHIAESGMAAVAVEYHCYRARPSTGAEISFDPDALLALQGLAFRCGIRETITENLIRPAINSIGQALKEPASIRAILSPPGGEYQNFGVLQAMDHLYALDHLVRGGLEFDRRRIWLFGSSHGGYLAHLIHKFAPHSVAAVLDNSGYVRANPFFLGLGAEYRWSVGHLTLRCSVASRWDLGDANSPRYFGIAQDLIRHVSYGPHLSVCAGEAGSAAAFRMTNSRKDTLSPFHLKDAQQRLHRECGFDSRLTPFGGPGDEVAYAKSDKHGDVSLMKFFDEASAGLQDLPGKGDLDIERRTELAFDCLEGEYRVRHGVEGAPVSVQVTRT